MKNRKEQLLELAKRCEEGEEEFNVFIDFTRFMGWSDRCFASQTIHKGYYLHAVASLEKKLLPVGVWFVIHQEHGSSKVRVDVWKKVLRAYIPVVDEVHAPTEPLARLAALCKVLAEMEV